MPRLLPAAAAKIKNKMKKIKILLKMGFFLCLPLFILPFCYACNSGTTGNATLSSLQGEVLVKKAGDFDWIKGQLNMALKAGDAIKSATEANAIVTFFDGSTIELKADTQIEITELIKKQPKEIRLKQEIGETISRVKKLVDPASIYEIETLSAVIGVRGSSMLVNVAPDGTTVVQNLEGQISITSLGIEVKIPEGGTGSVTPG